MANIVVIYTVTILNPTGEIAEYYRLTPTSWADTEGEFLHVSDDGGVLYTLPEGVLIGRTVYDELALCDKENNHVPLFKSPFARPAIALGDGWVHLEKAEVQPNGDQDEKTAGDKRTETDRGEPTS